MSKPRNYESALHEELGMTDAEIRAELIAEGLDPDEEAQKLRAMIQRAIAKHRAQPATDRRIAEVVGRRFSVFQESASGGPPTPSASSDCEQSDIFELMKVSNPETMMWVRVSGWSMKDEGIRDGDMVLVDSSREAHDGDIVLAHLAAQGQVIKRLRIKANSTATLESANPDFEPIIVNDPADLAIHGVVVGRAGRL